jgi:putative transcriptional regulator
MGDPRFEHTVILLVRHDKDGALGIIINLPGEERTLAGILDEVGAPDAEAQGSAMVYTGGPVQPEAGFVVHSADYHRAETIDIDGRVAVTSTPEILRDIAHQRGPAKSLIAFGYAGWTAGQLESEIAQHAWVTTPESPKLVFDEDRDKLWDIAWAHRIIDL